MGAARWPPRQFTAHDSVWHHDMSARPCRSVPRCACCENDEQPCTFAAPLLRVALVVEAIEPPSASRPIRSVQLGHVRCSAAWSSKTQPEHHPRHTDHSIPANWWGRNFLGWIVLVSDLPATWQPELRGSPRPWYSKCRSFFFTRLRPPGHRARPLWWRLKFAGLIWYPGADLPHGGAVSNPCKRAG